MNRSWKGKRHRQHPPEERKRYDYIFKVVKSRPELSDLVDAVITIPLLRRVLAVFLSLPVPDHPHLETRLHRSLTWLRHTMLMWAVTVDPLLGTPCMFNPVALVIT